MRRVPLILALGFPGGLAGTDLSGTWIGTWEHQGESQGACLYLLQHDKGLEGQIAYRHDTRGSSIEPRLSAGDIVEFWIADDHDGVLNLRLKLSETVLGEMVLLGAAATTRQSEP